MKRLLHGAITGIAIGVIISLFFQLFFTYFISSSLPCLNNGSFILSIFKRITNNVYRSYHLGINWYYIQFWSTHIFKVLENHYYLKHLALHLMFVIMLPLAILAGWFPLKVSALVSFIIIYTIVYFIIWSIEAKRNQNDINEINAMLSKRKVKNMNKGRYTVIPNASVTVF